jgi:regulator of replication initiation timing
LEFETVLRNWATLVQVQVGNTKAEKDSPFAKKEVFNKIEKLLREQVTLLSQISQRENSVREQVKELETLQQDRTAPTNKEKNIKIDAVKHKLNALITENRLFRLEQLRLYEQKCWKTFRGCSKDLARVYIKVSNQNASCSILSSRNSKMLDGSISRNRKPSTNLERSDDLGGSSESVIAPLQSAPKPPPYSEGSKTFPRASGVPTGKRGSVGSLGLGVAGTRRFSYSESVPSISVHHSEDDVNAERPPVTPPQPELLDPSRSSSSKNSLSASSPFLSMMPPKMPPKDNFSLKDLNPVKPPPPIPKGRRQSGKGSQLFT